MKTLKIPEEDCIHWYEYVAYNKRPNTYYVNNRNLIEDFYKTYSMIKDYPDILFPIGWDDFHKEKLLHQYSDNDKLTEFSLRIREEFNGFLERCPYCGIDRPKTLDHFLPKQIFPEYSIMLLNLIPCCGYCNLNKGTKYLENNGTKSYCHVYFDNINESQYLMCNLRENNGTWEAEYYILENSPTFFCNHIANLKLLIEYKRYSRGKLNREVKNIKSRLKHSDKVEILCDLESNATYVGEDYGINSWEYVLLKELIKLVDEGIIS